MKTKKKKFKWLKRFFIFIITIIAIVYVGVFLGHKVFFKVPYSDKPTVQSIGNKGFQLGAAAKAQPLTISDFIKVFALQVKRYNEVSSSLWPNNPLVNQYVIADDYKNHQIYLIAPNGHYKKITQKEMKKYGIMRMTYNGGWSAFNKNGIEGAYIALDENALTNYYSFERYQHIGSYDPFSTYAHELFHVSQNDWSSDSESKVNEGDRLDDSNSRKKRMLLIQQLMLAISDKNKRDIHTRDAVSTYIDYKHKNKKDYKIALLKDRIEGTAYYYELMSSLYAGYPEIISTDSDVYHALELLMANDNPMYRATGLPDESYEMGGFAGILLDMQAIARGQDSNDWKRKIEKDPLLTPMDLLASSYQTNSLPAVKKIPTSGEYEKWVGEMEKMQHRGTGPQNIFAFLYDHLYHF
ncbi:hypothetical protein [Peribacillus muralis]|uniref:hypothetical protein n=1 Tax=Peribacillus muralis TaxID=264697 RepID=UPI0036714CAA